MIMNATNRRLAIFDKLLVEKKVIVTNLAEEFNVTPMTIRRDLSVLEKQGVITTYYGGASLNEGAASEPSFMLKNKNSLDEKIAIAYEASKLINEGDSIYIDCGTTCYNIGRFIKNKRITVMTNSIRFIETSNPDRTDNHFIFCNFIINSSKECKIKNKIPIFAIRAVLRLSIFKK